MFNPFDWKIKMSETAQEALKSDDPQLIKQTRTAFKGKLTRAANSLINELKKDDSGKFLFQEIDKEEVESLLSNLQKVKNVVEELHVRYTVKRVHTEGSAEDALEKLDEDYVAVIDKTHHDAIKVYRAFCTQLKLKEQSDEKQKIIDAEKAQYPDKLRKFKACAAEYELAHQEALLVINSDEEFVQRTASLQKEMLIKEYAELLSSGQDLLSLVKNVADADPSDIESFECSKVKLTHRKTLTSLETVIKKFEASDKKMLAESAPSPIISGDASITAPGGHSSDSNVLKIKVSAPKFSGKSREFAVFMRDFNSIVAVDKRSAVEIGALLKESIPTEYRYLIDNFELSEHKQMMSALSDKFGRSRVIVDECTAEIKRMKKLTNDADFIKFVNHLDKLKRDLSQLNLLSDVANTTVISEIETKLPTLVQRDWIKLASSKEMANKPSSEVFEQLLEFLEDTKRQAEYFGTEVRQGQSQSVKASTKLGFVNCGAVDNTVADESSKKIKEPPRSRDPLPCLACDDGLTNLSTALHPTNRCDVWKSLTYNQKREKVKCIYHPAKGLKGDHVTSECRVGKAKCEICKDNNQNGHHTWFCYQVTAKTKTSLTMSSVGASEQLNPVMVKTLFVATISPFNNKSGKLGSVIDDCSVDHYVTYKAIEKYNFPGRDVELSVEGLGGKQETYITKLYTVPVIDIEGNKIEYQCFGMDKIATADVPTEASYSKICKEFGLHPSEVVKPQEIDLLISARAIGDHPTPVKSHGQMVLYRGKFGKVLCGTSEVLEFKKNYSSYLPVSVTKVSSTIEARTMRAAVISATKVNSKKVENQFMDYLQVDDIGIDCNPRCGGCRCGQCAIGAKPMSLLQEREYKKFRDNLTYNEEGTFEDPGPYWETSLPWAKDKHEIVDNRAAVLAVMNSTKQKLKKDVLWEDVYEQQLKDLITNKYAREVQKGELDDWIAGGGKIFYMPHQMAPNPSSKSTPVRVVFNNALRYKGDSMNSSLELGPEILANLQGLLLRFRNDVVAASGDIKKMFYMVRMKKEESFMQLFVWRWKGEEKIRTYAMVRLVMGSKPSVPISGVAMSETGKLKDFEQRYPVAYEALTFKAYVDNIFHTGPSIEQVKKDIDEIEFVAAKGGFKFKEWIISGQDIPQQVISVHLPNQIAEDEERALGVNWDPKVDTLCIKVDVAKPPKREKKKNKFSVIITSLDTVQVKPILTLVAALSIHAKCYDPLGFVFPCKMIGNLLLRKSIQVLKKELKGPIPWDTEIVGSLADEWLLYFSQLVTLKSVKFPRSFKPIGVDQSEKPDLITFSDGNPDSFGTNAYVRWLMQDGSYEVRLLMSKAKLCAILQKGETVKSELNGATLQARLTVWIKKHSGVEFKNHYPFVDSRIVQSMLQKTSYGFSTFVGLRVGEIQQKTDRSSWLHIASSENIADILTRGASPDKLGPGSVWQCGPAWLLRNSDEWPASPPNMLNLTETEKTEEERFRVRTVCMISKSKKVLLGDSEIDKLISRIGSLNKLIRVFALVMRVKFADKKVTVPDIIENLENRPMLDKIGEVSASEYQDAWLFLIAHDQQLRLNEKDVRRLAPVTIAVKLSNYNMVLEHVVIGGRVKNFPIAFSRNTNIPILPASLLGKLIVRFYHNKFHKEPDTVVAHVRNDVWVIQCRKLASNFDRMCKICLVGRKHRAEQLMGDLPSIRSTELLPAWAAVNMDLFGPLTIRDECVKRGPRVMKKVWGIVFCCTLTRGVYLDIATDYSTESILHSVRRLMASKGQVQVIISDCGLQLQGASKELSDWRRNWDVDQLKRFGAERSLEWRFIMPNSAHQNGAVEIMVKLIKGIKSAYLKAVGDVKLTYNELHTMFLEIAQLCNERPIGLKPNQSTDPEFLSPNSLYLGRASDRIASGPFGCFDLFDDPNKTKTRFHLVQALTNQFWKVWMKIYFPTLLIRQKWHTERRNLSVGDVCLLRDANSIRGEWRLCSVSQVYPDDHGRVRNVQVKVSSKQDSSIHYRPGAPNYLNRHVCNLILLVPAGSCEKKLE